MDELLQDFLTETTENLGQLDIDLLNLEKDQGNTDLLSSIFRTIHTIKGTCGFIGLPRLEKVAHAGENVLGKLRDGTLTVTPDIISVVLDCIDRIKEIMGHIAQTESEPEGDDSALFADLEAASGGGGAAIHGEVDGGGASGEATETPAGEEVSTAEVAQVLEGAGSGDGTAQMLEETADVPALEATPQAETPKPADKTPAPQPKPAKPAPAAKIQGAATATEPVTEQSIRVNLDLLETLITSVSELVLSRNQLLQIARNSDNADFKVPLQRLNHVTSELQEGLMRTRMQPVGNAWSKLPRIVRDLSKDLHKEIELEMIGAETELDRQVIEIIKDPLTHMIRNSADHGLENTEERLSAGKKKTGKITLNAYHAGGHVIMEISDDGRGLNQKRIKDKIIANGLAKAEDVEHFSDTQIFQYIFAPGFSTAAAVTNVSGRGVGMDVVRTNIEKIGGSVEVRSIEGQGTYFTIKIPLTLAIVSALIIRSGQQKFAIPQVSILELVDTSGNNDEQRIEYINKAPVLRLRNKLLPLVSLSKIMGLGAADEIHENSFIIVTQIGANQFGLIVDEVYDTEEIVVKPVSQLLRQLNIYAGNTILGDGTVVMILDPKGIAGKVGNLNALDSQDDNEANDLLASNDRKVRFLVFEAEDGLPNAVPLALVVRLEDVWAKDIEQSQGRYVMQYRDRIMALVTLHGMAPQLEPEEKKPVLVFSNGNDYLGLVVNKIVDIVEQDLDIKLKSSAEDSYGSIVVNGQTTTLIDVDYLIHNAYPQWTSLLEQNDYGHKSATTLVLVDESALYRNLIIPFLEVDNFKVISFDCKDKAVRYMEDRPQGIAGVLADRDTLKNDIETFAGSMRERLRNPDFPVFILSSGRTIVPEEQAKSWGYTSSLLKLERSDMLDYLKKYFNNEQDKAA